MKKDEKLEKLLTRLGKKSVEPVPAELAEEIKEHIPARLAHHRKGMDSVNIIIDLRINRLAAAAAIIITVILCISFLGGRDPASDGIVQEGKLLMKYFTAGASADKNLVLTNISKFYENLTNQGVEVTYYGDSIKFVDSNSVLIHWKLSKDRHKVVFGDLKTETVTSEQLIELQSRMIQNPKK